MLKFEVYVKGISLLLIYENVGIMVGTMFEWISSTSFSLKRNRISRHSLDLMVWTSYTCMPVLLFLIGFYLYMLDIVDYFNADAKLGNGFFQPILLSYYPTQFLFAMNYVTRTVDITFYQWWEWNYDLFSTLFWPDAWVYWIGVGFT